MSALESIKYYVLCITGKRKKSHTTTYNLLPTTSKKGFTLIELMVAITIIAIISTIGLITYSKAQGLGRDAKRKQDLRSIAIALELFYQKNKRYPCSGAGWFDWQDSNSNNWLTDSSACTGGTNQKISPEYISTMPKDPINTGLPVGAFDSPVSGYGYWSVNSTYGTCMPGQYYILATLLENSKDKDAFGSSTINHCGLTLSPASQQGDQGGGGSGPPLYSAGNFLITAP